MSIIDDELMQEIQDGFLEEAGDLLQEIESNFLKLENDPTNSSIVDNIFRVAHTLKGSAAGVNFTNLSEFAHHVENLLVKLQKKEISPEPHVIDVLLKSSDMLKAIVEALREDRSSVIDTAALTDSITDIIEGNAAQESFQDSLTLPDEDHEEDLQAASQVSTVAAQKKKKSNQGDEIIKLPLRKIENMLNTFGEQVILQSALEHYREDIVGNAVELDKTILKLNKITHDLQQTAIALRMVSLTSLFGKMQRVVRDGSRALNKDIEFITDGDKLELDKTIVDEISSPLTHIIRNSVDHGIEDAEAREQAGKSTGGKISMKASYSGRYFYLTITDDGKGLDVEAIRNKAIQKGLIREEQELTEAEILDLVFQNGFSTKDKATQLSGRGVGMDAVKQTVEYLKGTIELKSQKGVGTQVVIKLPPSLAMFNGMVVSVAGRKYVIPNSEVRELHAINLDDAHQINPQEAVLEINDRIYTLVNIRNILKIKNKSYDIDKEQKKYVMLTVQDGNQYYGFLVDDILLQQRIVFKDLGEEAAGCEGISGGTILGDGKVALILEMKDLVAMYLRRSHGVESRVQ